MAAPVLVDDVPHAFPSGALVEAHDYGAQSPWRRAHILKLEPYRGRPGYRIGWVEPLGGGPWQQWHSQGGWVPETSVRAVQS